MIGLAVALAALAMPLSVSGHVSGETTPSRLVSIAARTAPGASCSLADELSGLQLHRTASSAGRATWRWRPSLWASGPDTVSVRCVKGRAHRSTEYFLILGSLAQFGVIRDYALHLVYWGDVQPDVGPAVMQLETDVKASLDAGATDNPFAVTRAYGDSLGAGDPRLASIDATDDSSPYPKPTDQYCVGVSTPCIGFPDVANEVTRVARQHKWSADNHTLVVLFTAPSVTVCYTRAPCTPQGEVCGYHALTPSGYAYADIVMSGVGGRFCGGSPAVYAIQTLEHEQDEAVVDPWGSGLEVADACEHDFAPVMINGNSYVLQSILEDNKCVFDYTP